VPNDNTLTTAADTPRRRLFYFNAGFLKQARVRRILDLTGYDLCLGMPASDDQIAVWGHSPYARRGEAVADKTGAALVRIEDAWLRSLFPGRVGEPPWGLTIDHRGAHFDSAQPSDLETLLATHPLDDTALLNRARGAIARLQEAHISKYNAFDPTTPCPDPGYVLVIDQTRGDASVTKGRADSNTFREMLYYAQDENPGARIVIKTHPETAQGLRAGYFGDADSTDRITLLADPVSPWALFEGATKIYTVSSQMGFEAIFAGHKPVVFGQPFYAGWGLTDDRMPVQRRQRSLTRAQLFAATMILYPKWYDPYNDRLCQIEQVIDMATAETRCWREDHLGWLGFEMRLWKRRPLQQFFGRHRKMVFRQTRRTDPARRQMVWASRSDAAPNAIRIEDGFLRSRGLGADLIPPLSLVCDDLGIYYDPRLPSRLEALITARATLRPDQHLRAETLIGDYVKLGLSKYNLGGALPDLPPGPRILVPGQVEDDASILTGAGEINTNLALLKAARAAFPDATILYKPHPDVLAGLRKGAIGPETAQTLADLILPACDPALLLPHVQRVFTMTSLLGFEALLHGVPVTTTGAPFYAGWGLTHDIAAPPPRRNARPTLAGLAHASLIDYPRYFDPITRRPCPPEVVMIRLASGTIPRPGPVNRLIAKLQGLFASHADLWR
jgi:capsular polysaccharide export protein